MLNFIEKFFTYTGIIIGRWGYCGVIAGMLLGSAGVPIPCEFILAFAGFMCADGYIDIVTAIILSVLGSMAGSYIAYAVGYFGGRPLAIKYGRYVLLSPHTLDNTEKVFKKHGGIYVLIGRLTPVIRTIVSFPAGITGMNLLSFTVYSLSGIIPCNILLLYLGYRFRQSYDDLIRPILTKYGLLAVVAMIILVIVLIARKTMRKSSNITWRKA